MRVEENTKNMFKEQFLQLRIQLSYAINFRNICTNINNNARSVFVQLSTEQSDATEMICAASKSAAQRSRSQANLPSPLSPPLHLLLSSQMPHVAQ